MNNPKNFHIIVIGSGPAGLFAAISASMAGAKVTVLEKLSAPARKLLASGGGRCNISNTLEESEFIEQFGPQGRFMTNALRELSSEKLIKLLGSWGVPCHTPDDIHYFPVSNKAEDILTAIIKQLSKKDIWIKFNVTVSGIKKEKDSFTVKTSDSALQADAVVLATGGKGYPKLGCGDSGYKLAERLGHKIIQPVPAMVALKTKETWPHACSGITLPNVKVGVVDKSLKNKMRASALLFTHNGLSGPAILNISGAVSRLLLTQDEVKIKVQLAEHIPDISMWRKKHGKSKVYNTVSTIMPNRLASILCDELGIHADTTVSRLTKDLEQKLINAFKGFIFTITGTEGFKHAMVTSGGVSLKEVHPASLASKIIPGIYFAGEMLDLAGPCGGFNLQWAAASGWLAGKHAARTDNLDK